MNNDPGEIETCEFCLQRYSYDMQYRCIVCDAPVCPLCACCMWEVKDVWCPECNKAKMMKREI